MTAMPEGAKRGRWISWSWNYGQLWSIMWVLGTEPRPSDKTQMLLISEPYLQLCLLFCLRGSYVAQTGLKLTMNLRMTLNFWFTCLHIPRAIISGIFHHVWFMGSLGTEPKDLFIADNHLSYIQLHPQLCFCCLFVMCSLRQELMQLSLVTH